MSHCSKDALTDLFGWFLQVLLAGLAFTCLILKRFCEPTVERRPWLIWFYDTSKQGMGALVIHLANVFLASNYQGDPCTWYIINFLLDSSVGLFILYIGIRLCQYLSRAKHWDSINFGEYGKPPSPQAWLIQCALYVLLMIVVKTCITLLMMLDFWDSVQQFILSPFSNPRIEVALVMLIIPFFVNALMFWVTDNFLMRKQTTRRKESLLQRARFRYRKIRREKKEDSESETLISADEELIGSTEGAQSRLANVTVT